MSTPPNFNTAEKPLPKAGDEKIVWSSPTPDQGDFPQALVEVSTFLEYPRAFLGPARTMAELEKYTAYLGRCIEVTDATQIKPPKTKKRK
jgi:hypothetical protein